MRAGRWSLPLICAVKPNTLAAKLYGREEISERHRHRYEFNNKFRQQLEEGGLVISGFHRGLDLVEILELPNHPFFIGVQFHPEFQSKPFSPHPIFAGFLRASLENAAGSR